MLDNIWRQFATYCTRGNVQFLIFALLVCSFPWSQHFNNIPSIALVVWYFLDTKIIQKLKIAFTNKQAWLFYIIFIWYAVWLLFSSRDAGAMQTMERKIPFLLFPIVLSSENYITTKRVQHLLMLLFISCVIAAIKCEIFACINYNSIGDVSHFIYEKLSKTVFPHPGHMGNYYCLVIIWMTLIFMQLIPKISFPSRMLIVGFVFLFVFIMQLTSKTILLFLLLFCPWIIYTLIKKIKSKSQIIYLTSASVLAISAFVLFNKQSGRIDVLNEIKTLDSTVLFQNSIGSRAMAVKESINLAKESPFIGYGTGEANKKLLEQLTKKNYASLVEWKMHTHNQYMHTLLDIGIFGLLYLVFFLLLILRWFIKKKNYLGTWFLLLVMVNLLTDDMLEIQAGLVFFISWLCIFLFEPQANEKQKII
jgi:O-antigen ligase